MQHIPVRHFENPSGTSAATENFSIRSLQQLTDHRELNEPLHRHDFYYLLAIETGAGLHEIDLTPYPVRDESVFLLRPGQMHRLHLHNHSQGFLLQFRSDFVTGEHTPLLRRIAHKNYCTLASGGFSALLPSLTAIMEEFAAREEGYLQMIRAQLLVFLIALTRQRHHQEHPLNAGDAYSLQRLDQLLELIESHLTDHLPVSDYADQMHLSPYQLNAITKSTLGKTCSQVLNDALIMEAKRHLLATTRQINQISWDLGYEDPSYFIRFFKKHTGLSPEAFRNQHLA